MNSVSLVDGHIDGQGLTDEQIIKALECCRKKECNTCPCYDDIECGEMLIGYTIDLINRQKAEIERLEYVLMGVMHSVDKWLEGDELKQDEVNRAATMREKTLQMLEDSQDGHIRTAAEKDAEIDKLKAEIENLDRANIQLMAILQTAQSEARKEYAERLKKKATYYRCRDGIKYAVSIADIDNLLKEE